MDLNQFEIVNENELGLLEWIIKPFRKVIMTMNKKQIENLNDINRRIYNCKECSFHKELVGRPFRPDLPQFYEASDYKVMVVGINPSWDGSNYNERWRNLYEKSYEAFKAEFTIDENEDNNVYKFRLTHTFNQINEHLSIVHHQSINPQEIYKHIFWSNLSFCCSKNTKLRFIGRDAVKCNVYGEEINKCINQGYLKEIISTINPELIIFFGSSEKGIARFLSKLFSVSMNGKNTFMKKYTAFRRNGKNIEREFIAVRIENSNCKIISMPHPSYPFCAENKIRAIEELCDFLKTDHKLSVQPEPIRQSAA